MGPFLGNEMFHVSCSRNCVLFGKTEDDARNKVTAEITEVETSRICCSKMLASHDNLR